MKDLKAAIVVELGRKRMLISPLVLGVSSNSLSQSEVSILNEINPYGLILFTRNVVNKLQLKKLINEVKGLGRYTYPHRSGGWQGSKIR